MDKNSQLEMSTEKFESLVRALFQNPCLETALYVNLASMRIVEKRKFNEGMPPEEIRTYTRLMDSCVRKFLEMIPELDGQAWHVDMYRQQMQWRREEINRAYDSLN